MEVAIDNPYRRASYNFDMGMRFLAPISDSRAFHDIKNRLIGAGNNRIPASPKKGKALSQNFNFIGKLPETARRASYVIHHVSFGLKHEVAVQSGWFIGKHRSSNGFQNVFSKDYIAPAATIMLSQLSAESTGHNNTAGRKQGVTVVIIPAELISISRHNAEHIHLPQNLIKGNLNSASRQRPRGEA